MRTVEASSVPMEQPRIRERVLPELVPERQETISHPTKPMIDLPEKKNHRRLKLPVSLDTGVMDFAGDFSLDFSVMSGDPGLAIDTSGEPVVFELSEVDRRPRPIIRYEPVYPYRARRREIEGHVLLSFVVDASGHVENIGVLDSEPGELFVKAARQAVEGWRFEPAMKDGRAVSVRVEIDLIFDMVNQR
jgi:protein TonB